MEALSAGPVGVLAILVAAVQAQEVDDLVGRQNGLPVAQATDEVDDPLERSRLRQDRGRAAIDRPRALRVSARAEGFARRSSSTKGRGMRRRPVLVTWSRSSAARTSIAAGARMTNR